MADEKQDQTITKLYDRRIELAIKIAEIQLEGLKVNRQLVQAGHSLGDLQKLNEAAFSW